MRIGIVTGEYPPMQGGVGAFSRIIATTLARRGHDIHVLTHVDAEATPGITVANVIHRWGYSSLATIRNWARAEKLHVVNLQYQTAAYAMSPWIHLIPDFVRNTVPVVTTFHDLRFPYLFPKAGPLRTSFVRHLARASAGAIVTNAEDAQTLSDLPKVRLIPIGSNITSKPNAAASAALRASLGDDAYMIGFFGFMNESKGLLQLLESLAQLQADGVPARLVIIGGRTGSSDPTNSAFADHVDTLIQQHNLAADVHFTGYVTDAEVANWLAACDVVALPFLDGASYRRGTLMAAIQHGCAIVTTTPKVAVPAFVDGENMRLVPPDDANALATALRDLYAQPAQRQRLHEGAVALRPLFDWAQIARDTFLFFETIR